MEKNHAFFFPQKDAGLYIPGTPMTSIFEGQPPKTRPKLLSKQGAPFGFQVEIGVEKTSRNQEVSTVNQNLEVEKRR